MFPGGDAFAETNGRLPQATRPARSFAAAIEEAFWAERDRWPLWLPVSLAFGIALYFGAAQEPTWAQALTPAGVALVAATAVVWQRKRWDERDAARADLWMFVALGAVAMALGYAAAKTRTALVAAPVIAAKTAPVTVEGSVDSAARQPNGSWRLTLTSTFIDGLEKAERPKRLRLSVWQPDTPVEPGQQVRLRGVLMPPPGPAAPDGFDFARQAWFQQLGGVGYALGPPTIIGDRRSGLAVAVARLRFQLSQRIREALPGTSGALATALMTGDRDSIPEWVSEAMRISGLAHILAISGLHMALVGGFIFAAMRLVLSGIEPLALHYPIKKWAAWGGLIGALAYLIVSGASISAQRAFVMIALMFVAVLLDRPALSMRAVAAAAAIVLLLTPESLLHVSFQMSFAAVIGLIAFFEWQRDRFFERANVAVDFGPVWRWLRRTWLYVLGIAVTTIVAELAIGPFAAFHFNRLSAFGLVANVMAMPLVGLVVMPSAVAAFLLMPMGLEHWALSSMGWGIDQVIEIAREVSSWQGAEIVVPAWPSEALVLIVLGGLWLALWRRPWRRAGFAAIAAGLMLAATADPPDIFIDREGKNVAIRDQASGLVLLSKRRAQFAADLWYRRAGLAVGDQAEHPAFSFACDDVGCAARLPDRRVVTFVEDASGFDEDCRRADVIISDEYVPRALAATCRAVAVVIDRGDLLREGAHAIWLEAEGMRVESALDRRGLRPWTDAWQWRERTKERSRQKTAALRLPSQ